MSGLPLRARLYVLVVVLTGIALSAIAMAQLFSEPSASPMAIAALAALCVVSSSWIAKGINDRANTTLGNIVRLSAVPLVGVWGAVLVAAAALVAPARHEPLTKRVFNAGQQIISAAAAGAAYFSLGGGIGVDSVPFPILLAQILAADVVYCVCNAVLVTAIISMAENVPPGVIVRGTIAPQALSYLGYGMFGLLLAVLWDGVGVGPFAVILVLLPLYVAKWAYAQYAEQQLAYDRTIQTLVQAVETKDLYTRGHSERVSTASVMIARKIGMREDRVNALRYAGILHDVGKLGVPTRVLQKSGRLTDEEYEAIKLHPVRGLEVVRQIEFLGEAYAGIMHHHERIDGRGYPMGLSGDQIPEFARVIAVADAFDSMTTTRSYRDARPIDEAIAELHRCAGTQFDPVMVEAMVRALEAEPWAPEVPPPVPVDDEQAEGIGYDHDDPTVTIGPGAPDGGSSR